MSLCMLSVVLRLGQKFRAILLPLSLAVASWTYGSIARAEDAESLWFRGSDKTSDADLAKAAKALVQRCKEYGYDGIKSKVERKADKSFVHLEHPDGFSLETRTTIEGLARFAGEKVEVRVFQELPEGTKEQIRGKSVEEIKAKPPKGTKFYRLVGYHIDREGTEYDAVALRDDPVADREELLPPFKDKPEWSRWWYVLSPVAQKRFAAALGKTKWSAYFVVDGVALAPEGDGEDHRGEEWQMQSPPYGETRIWWKHCLQKRERRVLEATMKFPMPCGMTLAADAEVEPDDDDKKDKGK